MNYVLISKFAEHYPEPVSYNYFAEKENNIIKDYIYDPERRILEKIG